MTLGQETRWAYSTMLRSPHGALLIMEQHKIAQPKVITNYKYYCIS